MNENKIFGYDVIKIENTDSNFPERLKNITNKPKALYMIGNIELLNKNEIIAIVGSRDADKYGIEITKRFSKTLSENDICIISGLARGIDTIAHLYSLVDKGKTIAVLASGFNHIYPKENEILVEKILKNNGLIISEYPPEQEIDMSKFRHRNRIISGMSLGVLVVEARANSGSLITANLAIKQSKPVFCIPGNLTDPLSLGCNKLISNGANLVISPLDIINYIGLEEKEEEINSKYKDIYYAIGNIPSTVDEIIERSGKTVSEVNTTLVMLELEDKVINLPGGVTFASDSANISSGFYYALNGIAQTLVRYPETRIQVNGYTDSTGGDAHNQELSQRRANSVAQYLISQGVSSNRIVANGFGSSNPIASNATPEGRQANRRVEVRILPAQ
mgnify:CR=1 FL=1